MMSDDMTLVREFASNQSETAFAALVERHIALVHSSALRQVGDPHLAEEITQAVFIIFARKARSLGTKTILSAWLYRTTRYAAADALKAKRRRQTREQEAYMQSTLNHPDADAWAQLAPLLDEAMASLSETDRAALVLRFFENKTAREIAGALRMGEAAAQKRVARALEKLRALFVKRGVTLAATVIAGAVAANSVQAAPARLAVTVTAAAKGAVVASTVTTLVKGTLEMMTWLKVKLFGGCIASVIIIISGALILNLSGAGTSLPDDSSVAAFKNYLSRPPRISRIVYSELETGRRVIAAVDGENLYFREIKPGENPDLPIGAKNTMRGTPFVGRIGDMRWQIAGFNMTKAFHADTNNPDPYTSFADAARVILNGILNLGSQHVEPGSFI
jgi:RNA polymerase sigma factor (sigma-70 family)